MLYAIIPAISLGKIKFFTFYMAYLMSFEFLIAMIFIFYYRKLKGLMQRYRDEEYENIKNGLQK
jgi:hypothetical protein